MLSGWEGAVNPDLLGLFLTMKPLPHESQYFQQHGTQGRISVLWVGVRWREGVPHISAIFTQDLVSTSRWSRTSNADILHLSERKLGAVGKGGPGSLAVPY